MKALYWTKRLLCWLGIPFTEICQRCGGQVKVVWQAPDDLWSEVTGREGGVLCVKCFTRAFRRCSRRILYWRVSEIPFGKGLEEQKDAEVERLRAAVMRVDWHFVLGRLAFESKPGPDRVAHAQVCRLVGAIEDSGITWTEGEQEVHEAAEAANRDSP